MGKKRNPEDSESGKKGKGRRKKHPITTVTQCRVPLFWATNKPPRASQRLHLLIENSWGKALIEECRLTQVHRNLIDVIFAYHHGFYKYDAFNRRTSKLFTRGTDAEPEFAEYTSDANTIGLWHYNETSGKVLDSSGNANHGMPPNKINRGVQGLFNTKAADFEGKPVRVPKSSSLSSLSEQLTVETWVYLDSHETKNTPKPKPCWKPKHKKHKSTPAKLVKHRGTLVRRPGSFRLRIQKKDLRISFRLLTREDRFHSEVQCDEEEDDDDEDEGEQRAWDRSYHRHKTHRTFVLSDTGIPQDEWVHIAAVYGVGKVSLYINGEKQADQKTTDGYVRKVSSPLLLGGNGFEGTLEETRISSIARTEFGNTSSEQTQQSVLRSYFYSGWRIVEERERTAPIGQTLGVERVARQFVDGLSIDEHLRQDIYDVQGVAIVQSLYYHEDARGDTVAISDGAGAVIARFEYSAYGEVFHVDQAGGLATPDVEMIALVRYGFQGRELDEEAGFYQFRHRYYNPKQGRWLSRDSIGYVDGLGLYEAFGGNPQNYADSLGQKSTLNLSIEYLPHMNLSKEKMLDQINQHVKMIHSIYDDIFDIKVSITEICPNQYADLGIESLYNMNWDAREKLRKNFDYWGLDKKMIFLPKVFGGVAHGESDIGSGVAVIGLDQKTTPYDVGAHELGHSLGLTHPWDPSLQNGIVEWRNKLWEHIANKTGQNFESKYFFYDESSRKQVTAGITNQFINKLISKAEKDALMENIFSASKVLNQELKLGGKLRQFSEEFSKISAKTSAGDSIMIKNVMDWWREPQYTSSSNLHSLQKDWLLNRYGK